MAVATAGATTLAADTSRPFGALLARNGVVLLHASFARSCCGPPGSRAFSVRRVAAPVPIGCSADAVCHAVRAHNKRDGKVFVVVNPRSGAAQSAAMWRSRMAPLFAAAGVEVAVSETRYAGHAKDLGAEYVRALPRDAVVARWRGGEDVSAPAPATGAAAPSSLPTAASTAAPPFSAAVVIGGDGSVNEFVTGAVEEIMRICMPSAAAAASGEPQKQAEPTAAASASAAAGAAASPAVSSPTATTTSRALHGDAVSGLSADTVISRHVASLSRALALMPLCVVACGSNNALARGLRTEAPEYAAWCVITGKTRPLDAIEVRNAAGQRTLSLCGVGWGVAGAIAAGSEAHRHLGTTRYAWLKLRHGVATGLGVEQYRASVRYQHAGHELWHSIDGEGEATTSAAPPAGAAVGVVASGTATSAAAAPASLAIAVSHVSSTTAATPSPPAAGAASTRSASSGGSGRSVSRYGDLSPCTPHCPKCTASSTPLAGGSAAAASQRRFFADSAPTAATAQTTSIDITPLTASARASEAPVTPVPVILTVASESPGLEAPLSSPPSSRAMVPLLSKSQQADSLSLPGAGATAVDAAPKDGAGADIVHVPATNVVTVGAINTSPDGRFCHASDGHLDLIIARTGTLLQTADLLLRYVGRYAGLSDERQSTLYEYIKASCVVIEPTAEHAHLGVNCDGQVFGGPAPFALRSLPALLTAFGEI